MIENLALERRVAGRAATGWLLPTLVVLFFLSGLSGLIYQVLWLRLLGLLFGVTIYAASTVLASFMGGLALGSFAAGRLVDRARNPLLWYGLAEVLVGLSALATPAALDGLERLYVGLYPSLPDGLVSLTLVRFCLSFVVLIVPTTLMGATLPIIVKSSLLRTEGLGERVSLLYATNTAGAIVGTLLAGFYLIGGIGIEASFRLAAALNVVVGALAAGASLATERDRAEPAAVHAAGAGGSTGVAISEGTRRLVLFVFGLSGFASLALEVVWFRVLVLFLQVSTYGFTVMLATFLGGIAAGSYLVTPLLRRRLDWLALLAALELAIAIVSLLSLAALARTYDVVPWARALLEPLLDRPFVGELALVMVASFLAIFPAALLLGVAFPIGLQLWAAGGGDSGQTGQRIGQFYSLNVFGAILGSIAAGFGLLPWFGSQVSFIVIAAISLLSGFLLLGALPRAQRLFALGAGGLSAGLFLAAALSVPNPYAVVLANRYAGEQPVWREEGIQTTVSVQQRSNGSKALYLDGLHQADDSFGEVRVHHRIGHLAMSLHPDPRQALVVGLGGGATAGAVSMHAGAEVDVVELSESVVRGAEWFSRVNYDVLRRPNTHLRVDDGRNYLMVTPKRYDVITADVIRPFTAGAGNLYSAEYFQLARNALKDDGLMLQWLPQRSETQYKLLLRTFLSVFPDATAWGRGSLLVGTKRPLQLDPADFERKLRQDRAVAEVLRSMGIRNFQGLLALYTAPPEELRQFVGPGPILTDDQPMVEYFLSLPHDESDVDFDNDPAKAQQHVRRVGSRQ